MVREIFQTKLKVDKLLWYATISLSLIGLVMVLSASSYIGAINYNDSYHFFKKQAIFMLCGVVLMLMTSKVNYKVFNDKRIILIGGLLTFTLLVLVFSGLGKTVNGGRRWVNLLGFYVSPSEFAKIFLIFYYSWWISKNRKYLEDIKGFFASFIVLGLFILPILKQPDLSASGIIVILILSIYFQVGVNGKFLGYSVLSGAAMAAYFILSRDYRIDRVVAVFHPFENALGSGYQVVQSLYALGSGGLLGLGIGNSRQKFLHLPERHTDFIFSITAEETGFIGVVLILFLFMIIFWRGYVIALKADSNFGKILALGITNMFVIQTTLNIMVAIGKFPTTGMTLPLISYGGSSLVISMFAIGVLMNISGNIRK